MEQKVRREVQEVRWVRLGPDVGVRSRGRARDVTLSQDALRATQGNLGRDISVFRQNNNFLVITKPIWSYCNLSQPARKSRFPNLYELVVCYSSALWALFWELTLQPSQIIPEMPETVRDRLKPPYTFTYLSLAHH